MKLRTAVLLCALPLTLAQCHIVAQEDYIIATEANALDAGHGVIFWKADCADTAFSADRIMHAPPTGAIKSRPYYETGCALADRVFTRVARRHDRTCFFVDGNGDVRKFHPTDGISTVSSATTPAEVPHLGPIAASSLRVFWTEDEGLEFTYSRIYQAPHVLTLNAPKLVLDLGSATEIDRQVRKILAHDSNRITYQSGADYRGRLGQCQRATRMEPGGGIVAYWQHTLVSSDCTALTQHGDDLYFATQSADRLTARVYRAPVTDPTSTTLLHTRALASAHAIMWLASDGDYLYYFDWVPSGASSGTGGIRRKEIGGGVSQELVGPFSNRYARDLCVQGDHLFWINTGLGSSSATEIRRLAVDAAAIERDLRLMHLEVIQVVQDDVNDVPLIARKPTVVRAFPRLWYSSTGETSITAPALNVILEGTRGGTPLPGSPLVSYNGGPILWRPTDRTDPDNVQALFYLPPEWVEAGTIDLTARVNPGQVVQESNFSNNHITETVNFENRARVCVSLYPLRHTHGTLGRSYSSILQSTFDRAEAVLPTPQMIVSFEGGDAIEEWEWDKATHGPYELSRSDEDGWKVLFKLNGRYVWHHMSPPYCSDASFAAALFNTFPERDFNGYSCWGSFLCFLDTRYAGINNPQSGITWAHELGHNYDRDHVNCPDGEPENVDGSYPYPPCQFGDNDVHMGYDPLTRTFFKWDESTDLMSYGRPRWPSEYTYRAIRNKLDLHSAAPPPAPPDTRAPTPQWYTGGLLYPDDHAEFEYTFEADSSATAILQARMSGSESSNYAVLGYSTTKAPLFQIGAGIWQMHDARGTGFVFGALLPITPGTKRLVFARLNPPQELGSITAGTGAPTVTITSPTGGGPAAGEDLLVTWKAVDPDNDPLTYQVRFSSDDGAHWKIIADELHERQATIEHGPLAGSTTCRVEVRATDGINSGIDISEQFTIPESDPEAWIFFDTVRGRRSEPLATVFSPVGQEVSARAIGYDAEDGPLEPTAFAWDVNGPDDYAGTGNLLRMPNLAPGTYSVGLTATDSSADTATANATLVVDPKHVPDTGTSVDFDGTGIDAAYADDPYPVSLRYSDAALAQLHAVYSDDALYLNAGNLTSGSYSLERFTVYIDTSEASPAPPPDPQQAPPPTPDSDDYRIRVEPNGDVSVAQGNGTSFTTLGGSAGIEARVWRGTETWNVEMRLPDSLTGGYNGQTLGLAFGHENRNSISDDTWWPLSMSSTLPTSWAPFVLGTYLDDPTDLDGDGLPDAWERDKLKGMGFDADDDPDKDGATCGEEWTAGTDPLSKTSHLIIVEAEYLADGRVRVRWPSVAGRSYALVRSDNLVNFTPIAVGLTATPPTNTAYDPSPLAQPAYYRVAVYYGR